ncbi:MAG: cytochrome c oxidase assembly protein [Anaerolineaceae bacterium]|nr:cytochrome c oxidase assembly protein [Anaerolineaceae bacterium]
MEFFNFNQVFSSAKTIWVWSWEPSILIGLALWTIGYILLVGPIRNRKGWLPLLSWQRQTFFHLGTLVAFVALVTPLDHLADIYLLSAHMVQHLLLLMVAPPLWLLGMPQGWFDDYIRSDRLQKILRWISNPVVAFLIYNLVFWGWHIPSLYDAALYNETIHIFEHLMFLAVAVIGWWPVLGFLPKTAPRASYPVQMLYLFATMVSSTLLGAYISLAQSPIYTFYLKAPPVNGVVPLPPFANGSRLWGLSIMDDQEIAGLIMWVPVNTMYLFEFMAVLHVWFRKEEKKDRQDTNENDPGAIH